MSVSPASRGYLCGAVTVHNYINTEMKRYSVVRPNNRSRNVGNRTNSLKTGFDRIFVQIRQTGSSIRINISFLKNGDVRDNCNIVDQYNRSLAASISERQMTGGLAIRTLNKALASRQRVRDGLRLHSGQDSRYTSKAFVEICKSVHVVQRMNNAGYAYDNAPMERSFNIQKRR